MNGIHDMGGMDGFGPVTPEQNEPVFHADWERRVRGLVNDVARAAGSNIDEFRHAIERMPPAQYLASSYYERWLSAMETLLVEHGVITREELLAKLSPGVDTSLIASSAKAQGPAKVEERANKKTPPPRFAKGDRVRARNFNPLGHTRLPRYVRGKRGVIVRDWGAFVFPDTNAHHVGTKPQHCYCVSFEMRELWGKAAERGRLNIDLWEDYIEADSERASKPKPKSRGKTVRVAARKKK